MDPKTTIEKLRILLPHWIEHNRSHGAEFRQWAAAARTEGAEPLAALLDKAAAHMAATDELLKKAAPEVGGPGAAPDHAQPHDHPQA
ncbi:MAG: hypothetical protein NTV49_07440 [Kiritimatiellaeota bacterium]|nr:hypothetical protein [Kiritimatiellota bacterium]